MLTALRASTFYLLLILYAVIFNTVGEFLWYVEKLTGLRTAIAELIPYVYAHAHLLILRVCGVNIKIYGNISPHRTLWISNHRSKLDATVLPSVLYRSGSVVSTVMKNVIRYIPICGSFICLHYDSIFVGKNGRTDRGKNLQVLRSGAERNRRAGKSVLIFPEGNTMTPDVKARSDAYADSNRLPVYRNLTLPRKTGFDTVYEAGEFDCIGNITIHYSDPTLDPLEKHSFDDLFRKFPRQIVVHVEYTDKTDLLSLFQRKDKLLTKGFSSEFITVPVINEALHKGWAFINLLILSTMIYSIWYVPVVRYVIYATTITSYIRVFL